jgi:hypothetical protein
MRAKRTLMLSLIAAVGLLSVANPRVGFAGDPTTEARAHYTDGQRLFNKKDYQSAIREFAAAEKIVPSGYNDYNLALCYDKLGDADPAIQYYRSYLQRVPDANNRAAVEASVARLDAALKSATMKADEARKADEAKKAAAAAAAAAKAEAAQKAADAAAAAEAAKKAAATPAVVAPTGPVVPTGPAVPTGPVGPTVAPTGPAGGSGPTVIPAGPTPTGDPQLDRVSAIDINAIRAQRGAIGFAASNGGQGTASPSVATVPSPTAAAATATDKPDQKAVTTPVYKKWWFWAIVLVGGYIVYDFATTSSSGSAKLQTNTLAPAGSGGMAVFHF